MNKYKVGIIGATGMVGQRFVALLSKHPWFEISVLAASASSAGKSYEHALGRRWVMSTPIPDEVKNMLVFDAKADAEIVAAAADFVFCAVNLDSLSTRLLEERYAVLECPVISCNSACRMLPDVPMIIPEINPEHADVIAAQRKRLGTKRGFIAVKSNCSIQSYVPALHPLRKFGLTKALVCTYQAISGAGKTFDRWPEIIDNIIPYISGEEEKSEHEPLKIWGKVEHGEIVNAALPQITTQCLRVPVSDGHTAAVFASFEHAPDEHEIKAIWQSFAGEPQKLNLPSAPARFIRYFDEPERPQPQLDRDFEHGMGISVGRLRRDSIFDYKFVCLSHNTVRGAAGGAILLAELLAAKSYFD